MTEEAGDRNVVAVAVDFAGVVGEVVGEDKAFVAWDVVGDDGDAADSKKYYLGLGGAIEVWVDRFPSPVLLRGTRMLDSSRCNIASANHETRGN